MILRCERDRVSSRGNLRVRARSDLRRESREDEYPSPALRGAEPDTRAARSHSDDDRSGGRRRGESARRSKKLSDEALPVSIHLSRERGMSERSRNPSHRLAAGGAACPPEAPRLLSSRPVRFALRRACITGHPTGYRWEGTPAPVDHASTWSRGWRSRCPGPRAPMPVAAARRPVYQPQSRRARLPTKRSTESSRMTRSPQLPRFHCESLDEGGIPEMPPTATAEASSADAQAIQQRQLARCATQIRVDDCTLCRVGESCQPLKPLMLMD